MAGYYYEDLVERIFTTVVMDGSNDVTMGVILSTIDMITRKEFGRTSVDILDEDHPTTMVIKVVTTRPRYDAIRKTLEAYYPGLCVYDPPVLC